MIKARIIPRSLFVSNATKWFAVFVTFFTHLYQSNAQSTDLIYLNDGQLQYTPFSMKGQQEAVNLIPDFSYAGYEGGGVAIPNIPVKMTLNPTGGDELDLIQRAIDSVSSLPLDARGFRGAILLKKGHYQVSDQLFIRSSGVVLRGEGQGKDGTVLFANRPEKHDFINISGTGKGLTLDSMSKQQIISAYVGLGSHEFSIADASGFYIGDTIAVRRTPNQFWIEQLGMGTELCQDVTRECRPWTVDIYTIDHERIIVDVKGNVIVVNIPIMDVMEAQFGGGEIYHAAIRGRIDHVGIENMRLVSYFASEEDENHGWSAIKLTRTINSWVKGVTGQYFGYGTVNIDDESNFNTIEESAAINHKSEIKGGRRYSFVISDGMGNLIQRCYTSDGRHDFAMGARVTGPNVFVDCFSTNTHADIGPHQRWAVGTLFDNIYGGQIRVRNRQWSGTGHGWVGNATMLWNLISYKEDLMVESPPGGMNWGIGCTGIAQNGAGYWASWCLPIAPRSLYYQQLRDRLGIEAVKQVTIPAQLNGNIYKLLSDWAGE